MSSDTDLADDRTLDDDRPDQTASPTDTGTRRRRIILIVILAVIATIIADMVIGAATHAEHQRHLAAEFEIPKQDLQAGDAAYVLQIPAIGINEVVVEGSSSSELRGGPGRRLDSAVPADSANTVIQAHSTRFGGPFGQLEMLKGGNSIYLRSRSGEVTAYKVTKVRVVGSDETKYLDATGPARVTLVASAGGPFDGRRMVVTATADDVASSTEGEVEAPAPAAEPSSEEPTVEEPTYDVRGLGGAVLLLCGIALVAVGIIGATGLRRDYSLGAVIVVAGGSIALGVILVLFNASMVLPTTY